MAISWDPWLIIWAKPEQFALPCAIVCHSSRDHQVSVLSHTQCCWNNRSISQSSLLVRRTYATPWTSCLCTLPSANLTTSSSMSSVHFMRSSSHFWRCLCLLFPSTSSSLMYFPRQVRHDVWPNYFSLLNLTKLELFLFHTFEHFLFRYAVRKKFHRLPILLHFTRVNVSY